MFYSLRFGILVAMLAVAAVAIATTTIFVSLTTSAQFSAYVEAGRELRLERVQQAVVMWINPEDAVDSFNNLAEMQVLSDGTVPDPGSFQFRPLGTVGLLEAMDENLPPTGELTRFEIAPDGTAIIYHGSEPVGTLIIDPVAELEWLVAQNEFVETVNWTLLITAILAGLAAVVLTVILSRRILQPVAALTQAVRRLGGGDLTQRVTIHASGEITELARAFNTMAESLSHQEELRRSMVSDIAHELRTPVTNIRGYLEAVQDGMLEPDHGTIDSLHEEAMLLNGLIQDLQELALAEAGQLRLEFQPVSLDLVVEQTVSMLHPAAKQKGVQLIPKLDAQLPPVKADQRRIAQVMRNLLNNAVTHTSAGGEVHIRAESTADAVTIHIADSGEGIDEEHLPFVFERFYRADPSRSRSTGGAGLGLAIVKQLIERQGGRIWAESVPGKGATFSFTLPCYYAESKAS
jgi:signal transduction histidine kinase